MTQMMLYASMLNIKIRDARMDIKGHWRITGSVFQQTRVSSLEKLVTNINVDSDADPALIAAVLRNASNGCHAEVALRNPTPIEESVSVNGDAFDIEEFPAGPVRRQPDA